MQKKESVAKGGIFVALARILGMGLSFVLFLILARHSAAEAGIFRTVATYIVISEFLGMLGMHRWLATEIAPEGTHRWPLFLSTTVFSIVVSFFLAIIYLAIASFNFYSEELNQGLRLGALAVIPSGIFACVQSALLGVGRNLMIGKLNLIENMIRCGLGIGLIYMDQPIIEVIWVFVIVRIGMAIFGFYHLSRLLHADHWLPKKETLKRVFAESPKFAVIIFAFLLLKNAALVMLPATVNESEVAVFAVAYQLFDLILLIPTILALTTNNLFVNKAIKSKAALNKASVQLISITSLVMFPCVAITAGFAHNFILLLYSDYYIKSFWSLIILMFASAFMMIDQVLSQVMLSKKLYKQDMIAVIIGAAAAVLLTLFFSILHGATGASIALLLAIIITSIARLNLLGEAFKFKLIFLSTWRPVLAATLTGLACHQSFQLEILSDFVLSKFLWISLVPFAIGLYMVIIYAIGGISLAKRTRMKQFLFHH